MSLRLLLALLLACAAARVAASDIQIKTSDGQTVQGEHLGTKDGMVKLKTAYGIVSIPEKNVVTITAAKASERSEPGIAEQAAVRFAEQKFPSLASLVARRLGDQVEPDYRKDERQELIRMMRNYASSVDSSRAKIVRRLKDYGTAADPFIDSAYTTVNELPEKTDLLQAAAVPGRNLSVMLFVHSHDVAKSYMQQISDSPLPPPPDYLTKRERENPRVKGDLLRTAANYVLTIEGYAATAGGPFNALFLIDTYRQRYTSDKEDPLLINAGRDRSRLASTANDIGRSRGSSWTPQDRVLLAEQVFPWLFRDNDELKSIGQEFLKKILPSDHPKWDATEDEWVRWWQDAREKILK
jgi:hypothetical protein